MPEPIWGDVQFFKNNPVLVIGVLLAIAFVAGVANTRSESEKESLGQFAVLIAIVLAVIFGLVKFVQWAWNS